MRGARMKALAGLSALKRAGQTTIELLLVLPVFMLMLFFIMEMGNLGFQTILAHHCAYELARIGSLVAGPDVGKLAQGSRSDVGRANQKMKSTLQKMFPNAYGVSVEGRISTTLYDKQSRQMAEDLVVRLTYPAKLIFPGSSTILADHPKSRRIKKLYVTVRMPVEIPFKK